MTKYYLDYFWKNGRPQGLKQVSFEQFQLEKNTYKVVADPYYKRISVERYSLGMFEGVVYDSALFNFRHLKPAEQYF